MELFEAIHFRRSIRKYTDQDVLKDHIQKILELPLWCMKKE